MAKNVPHFPNKFLKPYWCADTCSYIPFTKKGLARRYRTYFHPSLFSFFNYRPITYTSLKLEILPTLTAIFKLCARVQILNVFKFWKLRGLNSCFCFRNVISMCPRANRRSGQEKCEGIHLKGIMKYFCKCDAPHTFPLPAPKCGKNRYLIALTTPETQSISATCIPAPPVIYSHTARGWSEIDESCITRQLGDKQCVS